MTPGRRRCLTDLQWLCLAEMDARGPFAPGRRFGPACKVLMAMGLARCVHLGLGRSRYAITASGRALLSTGSEVTR